MVSELRRNLSFFRDRKGAEVDRLVDFGRSLLAVETKSGQTIASDFSDGLRVFESVLSSSRHEPQVRSFVVYGGVEHQRRSRTTVVPWHDLDRCEWWNETA